MRQNEPFARNDERCHYPVSPGSDIVGAPVILVATKPLRLEVIEMTVKRSGTGHLGAYIRRIMREKGISQRQIELRSNRAITDGYVALLLSGDARNPSVEKIKALAKALETDAHELFEVAGGPFESAAESASGSQLTDTVEFLELMIKVASRPALIEIVEELISLDDDQHPEALEKIRALRRE